MTKAAFNKIAEGLREAICHVAGHQWVEGKGIHYGHRHCLRCDKYEMLYENRYPEVGEPKYEWK